MSEYDLDLLVERQIRRVQLEGALRFAEGRHFPARVPGVSPPDLDGLVGPLGLVRLPSLPLQEPTPGPLGNVRCQVDLHFCAGKDHGPHISPIGHQPTFAAGSSLGLQEPSPDRRDGRQG